MNELLTNIYEDIAGILPSDWKKLVVHMSVSEGSHSMYFFVKGDTEQWYSYYDLIVAEIYTMQEFSAVSLTIGKKVHQYRKEHQENWTGFTVQIAREGNVEIDFEYTEQPLGVPQDWKSKYLK